MSDKMNTLATMAFSTQKKANKKRAMEIIEELSINTEGNDLKALAELYSYFKPTVPAKPKTDKDWVAKIVPTKDVRYYLNRLEVANGKLIATDGHRLHLCDTDLETGAYDILLNKIDEMKAGKFPDYKRVIPNHTSSLKLGDVEVVQHLKSIPSKNNDSVINEPHIDVKFKSERYGDEEIIRFRTKYWNEGTIGFSDNALVSFKSEHDQIKIEENGCVCVLMPVRKYD